MAQAVTPEPAGEENPMVRNRTCVLRLSRYKNALYRLKGMGFIRVFSDNLADAIGVTAPRVRKDFSLFGITGNKKGGYSVDDLIAKLEEILGTRLVQRVVVVGVGRIGRALMEYRGFERERIQIVAGFDMDPKKTEAAGPIPILPPSELATFVKANGVRIGIIAVPEVAAQQAFQMLAEAGVEGVLNFAPVRLTGSEGVVVSNVNLALELENLIYFVNLKPRMLV
jgi:redox-sensing transcriptional repressor